MDTEETQLQILRKLALDSHVLVVNTKLENHEDKKIQNDIYPLNTITTITFSE